MFVLFEEARHPLFGHHMCRCCDFICKSTRRRMDVTQHAITRELTAVHPRSNRLGKVTRTGRHEVFVIFLPGFQ